MLGVELFFALVIAGVEAAGLLLVIALGVVAGNALTAYLEPQLEALRESGHAHARRRQATRAGAGGPAAG